MTLSLCRNLFLKVRLHLRLSFDPIHGGCFLSSSQSQVTLFMEVSRAKTHKAYHTIAATRQTDARKFLANLS